MSEMSEMNMDTEYLHIYLPVQNAVVGMPVSQLSMSLWRTARHAERLLFRLRRRTKRRNPINDH